jgi:predicted nuclease of restriction endonuclease-like RecB superfamily
VLTKDLLRVSRAGGGYQPRFASDADEALPARVLGTYQGHVDEPRHSLQQALTDVERDADDFKLVRGFAKLIEREATFETSAPLPPDRARRATFTAAADSGGVVTEDDRTAALETAADRLGSESEAVEQSLYADRERAQILTDLDARWDPTELVSQYNLSLAQTAMFDATAVRVQSSDPKALVSAVKRLQLMYEIRKRDEGRREVVVTGPDSLFRTTRRYGTRFARLLRTIAKADEWDLEATIDDRGTERTMRLSDDEPIEVPNAEPIAEVSFDSGIESDFAARFEALDLDWGLVREPEPLEAGSRVMIPDFAFDYKYADFRVFFEIMGFWTPEYVEKKLGQLETLEDVEMLVAVDESLGVGEEIEARDYRAIPYSGSVRIKDVRDVLRRYEDELVAELVDTIPEELRPDSDVISLADVATDLGTSQQVLDDVRFPEHEQIGQTLVREPVLHDLRAELEPGMSLADAERLFETYEIEENSALLSELGYKVEWEGLSGGTIRAED